MPRGFHSPEEQRYRQSCRAYVACPRCGAEAGQKCIGARGQRRAANHTERWQAFDPTHVAAKAPRKEETVARIPDDLDMEEADERADEHPGVTCSRCGEADLHWQMVTAPDGRSERPVLFNERMQRHVCRPSADDFEALA